MKAKKFVVAKHFEGEIKDGDLVIEEETLPALQNDECLLETLYLSVDPYMRAYSNSYKIGQTMIGGIVGRVIESKSPAHPVGTHLLSNAGWRTHTIIDTKKLKETGTYALPDFGSVPVSLALGTLGMPGNTAYFGFLDLCSPKAGETVVVTGAAGAVGNHVGQLAKIWGCKVIGVAGSDDKAEWLKEIGFDHIINYKTVPDFEVALRDVAPEGVDCYFDNVGGEISSIIINQMNLFGRISVCGSISAYNDTVLPKATIIQPAIVKKQLEIRGFLVTRFLDRWHEGIAANLKLIQEGKLKFRETVTEGFENMPRALIGILRGENIGKAVVKVATK